MKSTFILFLIAIIIFFASDKIKAQHELDLNNTSTEVVEVFLENFLLPVKQDNLYHNYVEMILPKYLSSIHSTISSSFEVPSIILDLYTTNYTNFKLDSSKLTIKQIKDILAPCFVDTIKFYYVYCINKEDITEEEVKYFNNNFNNYNLNYVHTGDTLKQIYIHYIEELNEETYVLEKTCVIDTLFWEIAYQEEAIIDFGATIKNIFNNNHKNDTIAFYPVYNNNSTPKDSNECNNYYQKYLNLLSFNNNSYDKSLTQFRIIINPFWNYNSGVFKVLVRTHNSKVSITNEKGKKYIQMGKYKIEMNSLQKIIKKSDNEKLKKVISDIINTGNSKEIDYNHFETNIRLILVNPPVCEPVIFCPSVSHLINFKDNDTIKFEFQIAPFQGYDVNLIEVELCDSNKKMIKLIDAIPLDKIIKTGVTPPFVGGTREYLADLKGTLKKGNYFIFIKHEMYRKSRKNVIEIRVE